MNLEEFETQYREEMDEVLNQLQTVMLLLAQIESKTSEVGHSIQNLSQTVEEFINRQRQQRDKHGT